MLNQRNERQAAVPRLPEKCSFAGIPESTSQHQMVSTCTTATEGRNGWKPARLTIWLNTSHTRHWKL